MGAMITVYGIPNCDTVRKARAWLSAQGLEHRFHDFKKQGVPESRLDAWLTTPAGESLLNRRGTTWRGLDAAEQMAANDIAGAKALMMARPGVIKRPVVEWNDGALPSVTVGFDAAQWAARER